MPCGAGDHDLRAARVARMAIGLMALRVPFMGPVFIESVRI
ncbi:hypothetical protein CP97_14651 [Aurantiacibacter atlanticus]|uniref:Uncharacterized protein n=1 Tax=Aurantiacibacter atlanticus TaxID=1648404 RepID=A0A168M078_9SPHN|nr:hypothetical protein CP97_14651 [Aurantiacibacter atlanticus]